jgi:hypothetical protein
MSFKECVQAIFNHPEFLREYDRLRGTTFSRSSIESLIDKATGKFEEDAVELFTFIRDHIWLPIRGTKEK